MRITKEPVARLSHLDISIQEDKDVVEDRVLPRRKKSPAVYRSCGTITSSHMLSYMSFVWDSWKVHCSETVHRSEAVHRGEADHRGEVVHRSETVHRGETDHSSEAGYRGETDHRGEAVHWPFFCRALRSPVGRWHLLEISKEFALLWNIMHFQLS